jgi:hypothetical protein
MMTAESKGRYAGYYSEIKPPRTTREGLRNHVQMAVNQIAEDEIGEALYLLVDLVDSLTGTACYRGLDENTGAGLLQSIEAVKRELTEKHSREVAELSVKIDQAYKRGRADAKEELRQWLGVGV